MTDWLRDNSRATPSKPTTNNLSKSLGHDEGKDLILSDKGGRGGGGRMVGGRRERRDDGGEGGGGGWSEDLLSGLVVKMSASNVGNCRSGHG